MATLTEAALLSGTPQKDRSAMMQAAADAMDRALATP